MNKASDIDISKIDIESPEFQNALHLVSYASQSVFLTGKAGTGKSTFLTYLTHTTKKRYVVLAPTGIAAVNSGGQTLHSFFKLPFKPLTPDDPEFSNNQRLRDRMKYNKDMVKLLRSLDLIIIDEVSMVRADIIDFIDRLLKTYCGNWRQPFAGKQLLLVGDVFQLEPVITGEVRDILANYYPQGSYFFNAHAFRDLPIVPIELKKAYRQTDANFISMLDRVRIAQPTQTDINLLNSRLIREPALFTEDFVMTIATRRDIVDHINETHLNRLPAPPRIFEGMIRDEFPENSLPTDKTLVLKEEAQVVFVKNDMERRWVNGTIGKIAEFTEEAIVVELEDGTKHSVEPEVWENIRYEYDEEKKEVKEIVIGTFQQYPLKLAWAITIHKSQGLTFDRVIIDVGQGAFSGGQTYVALSRCRTFDGLKLRSTINARDIFVNPRVVEFSRSFNNQGLINNALENARADALYHDAATAFNHGEYSQSAELFAQAVCARNVMHMPNAVRLLRQKLQLIPNLQSQVAKLQAKITDYEGKLARLATEYVEMGEACREEGWELQAALANYEKAISLSPKYHYAWLCKGLALAQMGEYDAALQALDNSADLDETDFRPLYEAGRLIINHGDLALGMDYLLRALQRNDKIADIHLALADGYESAGETGLAANHRREARRLKRKK